MHPKFGFLDVCIYLEKENFDFVVSRFDVETKILIFQAPRQFFGFPASPQQRIKVAEDIHATLTEASLARIFFERQEPFRTSLARTPFNFSRLNKT